MKQNNQKGFTLIELLVVIAIIGLLASVVLLALNSARAKSRDAKRVADIRQLSSAMELYYNDQNGYPSTMPSLETAYVGDVPSAPLPADGTCTDTPGSNTYTFTPTGTTDSQGDYSSYNLTFCLGGATGSLTAGVRTASPAGIQ